MRTSSQSKIALFIKSRKQLPLSTDLYFFSQSFIFFDFLPARTHRGSTKNPADDLELILVHYFSRSLPLDFSSVLSTTLNSYFTHLNNHSKYGRPKVLKSVISAHSQHSFEQSHYREVARWEIATFFSHFL